MTEPKIERYMSAAVNSFVVARQEIQEALALIAQRIRDPERAQPVQLLAVRRYVRLGDKRVRAQWAWTAEETNRMIQSGPAQLLMSEAATVQRRFAKENPGFSLEISPLRSLDRQVLLWSKNNSVHTCAASFVQMVRSELQKPVYAEAPDSVSTKAFLAYLRNSEVKPEPTSAAPGVSDHGQMRAVDFVVKRGNLIVAGTDTPRIASDWERTGFDRKLKQATSGTSLVGPLQHPREPWHYRLGP